MPFSETAKNSMLNSINPAYFSAHTGAPGSNGANEVTGGSYARGACTFASATSAARSTSAATNINIPEDTTVTHVGLWTASTGGVFLGYVDIADTTFSSDGVLTINSGAALTIS